MDLLRPADEHLGGTIATSAIQAIFARLLEGFILFLVILCD
jgi:hypothetical protein